MVQVYELCFVSLRLYDAGHTYTHDILTVFGISFLISGFSCLALFFSSLSQIVERRFTCSGGISFIAETALGISLFFVEMCVQHTKQILKWWVWVPKSVNFGFVAVWKQLEGQGLKTHFTMKATVVAQNQVRKWNHGTMALASSDSACHCLRNCFNRKQSMGILFSFGVWVEISWGFCCFFPM